MSTTMQEIKKELEFNNEMAQLFDILKGIAAAEFHALEKRKERFAKFIHAFEDFFQMIDFDVTNHPFSKDRLAKLGIIAITSDEGFMGGLNSRVINTALQIPGAAKAKFIVVGNKGAFLLDELGYDFAKFPSITRDNAYEQALNMKDYIVKLSLAEEFSRLVVVYPKPESFTVHKINTQVLLPCSELVGKAQPDQVLKKNLIIESPIEGILEYLMEAWITQKIVEVFEDSKLSEFSARTVHLDESYQVLLENNKVLNLQYFRSYHELLDRGMREVFAGRFIKNK